MFSHSRGAMLLIKAKMKYHPLVGMVPVLDSNNGEVYLVDSHHILGEGSFGEVYTSYRLDANAMIVGPPLAIKKMKSKQSSADSLKEVTLLRKYYKTAKSFYYDRSTYQVMDKLLGEPLYLFDDDDKYHLNELITMCNLAERIDVIVKIALFLNNMHHHKPSTGQAVIHGDLKGENILIHIAKTECDGKNKRVVEVHIIDSGLANELRLMNSDDCQDVDALFGTPEYIAPEIFDYGKQGGVSDVYALAAIFLIVLGASNVFANKDRWISSGSHDHAKIDPAISNALYQTDGVFAEYRSRANYPDYLYDCMLLFIDRMQCYLYDVRPRIVDVLKFFITAANWCKLWNAGNAEEKDVDVLAAKLIMLANGLGQYDDDIHSHPSFCRALREQQAANKSVSMDMFNHLLTNVSPSLESRKYR